jgi:hypothetical protein
MIDKSIFLVSFYEKFVIFTDYQNVPSKKTLGFRHLGMASH